MSSIKALSILRIASASGKGAFGVALALYNRLCYKELNYDIKAETALTAF